MTLQVMTVKRVGINDSPNAKFMNKINNNLT